MTAFFSRERFSTPQVLAGVLLLIFMAQCLWLISRLSPEAISPEEAGRVQEGLALWRGDGVAESQPPADDFHGWTGSSSSVRSPLWYLIEAAPLVLFHVRPDSEAWIWLTRIPCLFVGVLLGASLWYVSRRLYGNSGGYIALTLYCFSPALVRSATLWFTQPDIPGAWGAFGAVFTAIAVAHTLYAPREVVLWNWRRIVLLGVSLALAIGTQFGLAVILPAVIGFMLYLAPTRRLAALLIFVASCLVALLLLFASYFFHLGTFLHSLASATFLDFNPRAFAVTGAYVQVVHEISAAGPVLIVLAPTALFTYASWPRARYFGNTAPLLIALLFLVLRIGSPHVPQSVFGLTLLVLLIVFISGVAADLLESKHRDLTLALVAALLVANSLWSLFSLGTAWAFHPGVR